MSPIDLRERIARRVERPRPRPAQLGDAELKVGSDFIGCLGPKQPAIGLTRLGEPFGPDLRYGEAHGMFIGWTGTGKSVAGRVLVTNLVKANWQVIIVEPKIGDYQFCEHQVSRVHSPEGITNALHYAAEEVGHRQAAIGRYRDRDGLAVEHYSVIPGARPPLAVVLDEIAVIIGKSAGFHRELVMDWFECIAHIGRVGRSADVHLWAMTQLGTVPSFGPGDQGNTVRSALQARGSLDGTQNMGVITDGRFEVPDEVEAYMAAGIRGRMAFVNFTLGTEGIDCGQVLDLSRAQAHRICTKHYSGITPMAFELEEPPWEEVSP